MRIAAETGFLERLMKMHPCDFLLTLVSGIYSQEDPTIARHHRFYNSLVPKNVVYESFYDKFSEECVDFVQACVSQTMERMLSNRHVELIGYLRKFNDLLIQDNSIVRIHSCFADWFPATRSRKVAAGIKVAFLFSVVCNSPKTLTFFPERTNDAKTLKIGSWVKDNLLLIDPVAGYYPPAGQFT